MCLYRAEQLAQVQHKVEELTPRKGEANYGSLKRSSSRGGTLKKYKFVSSDHLDEESFSKLQNTMNHFPQMVLLLVLSQDMIRIRQNASKQCYSLNEAKE